MICAVCGTGGGVPLLVAGEVSLGCAHAEVCAQLLWESRAFANAPRHEQDELAWRWRRRVAEVRGQEFSEPPPKSPNEIRLEVWAASIEGEDTCNGKPSDG